jgi:hypothetical protein
MTLTSWDWFNLAMAALFVSCMTVLIVQHWRGTGESPLMGGGRVTGTAWALGMIGLVLSVTLPVSDAVDDGLGLGSAVLMLVALVVSHLQPKDETPEA